MRIALIHARVGGRAGGGGGPRLMLELGVSLKRLGHDVTVVCHDFHPGDDVAEICSELEIRSVRTGPYTIPFGKRAALRQFWRQMPRVAELVPACVQVINAHEWPALRAARLAADRLGVPFVWTRHDHTIFERAVVPGERHDASSRMISRLPRAALTLSDFRDARRASAVVTLDDRSRRMAERAFRRPVQVARCGPADRFFDPPDRDESRRLFDVPGDAFFVLGVGILTPHRRFEDLIDAVALQPRDRNLIVSIIGSDHSDPGYADFLEERMTQHQLGDRVRLLRRGVSEHELRSAYSAADLFVFPNDHRQTWGLAPLEALASGTPVVLTRDTGLHEVLGGRPGVLVVAPHSPAEIAHALTAARADRHQSNVQTTRAWVREALSIESYAKAMSDIYERAAGRVPAAGRAEGDRLVTSQLLD